MATRRQRWLFLTVLIWVCIVSLIGEQDVLASLPIRNAGGMDGGEIGMDDPGRLVLQSSSLKTNNDDNGASNGIDSIEPSEVDEAEAAESSSCDSKQWAVNILRAADRSVPINDMLCRQLPTEEDVAAIYGKEPVIHGLETCAQFRQNTAAAANRTVRVAGLFHTGTNALSISLGRNLRQDFVEDFLATNQKPRLTNDWLTNHLGVPWGKHVPLRFRGVVDFDNERSHNINNESSRNTNLEAVLPVVLVRDPYWWMRSLCRESYQAVWQKRGHHDCPNLVTDRGISNVSVAWENRRELQTHHASIVTLWNDWNREYFGAANFPRLVVRFEDQLFHAEAVLRQISACAGLPVKEPFQHHIRRSKKHGRPSDFVSALTKYSSTQGRKDWMDPMDQYYASRVLDAGLMEAFGYRHDIE